VTPIRVVVADDQDAVRAGLVLILDAAPDIAVVGEVRDGNRPPPRCANCGRTSC